MGKYLDLLPRREEQRRCDRSDISDQRAADTCARAGADNPRYTFGRIKRFCRTFEELERRCPAYVDHDSWQAAIEDGRRFLARWGERAEALGWTSRDLFGLHAPPERPGPSYRRLSRYDETGLVWLLNGREVTALTAETAAIRSHGGAITVYRKIGKPALGPLGDSLEDFRAARDPHAVAIEAICDKRTEASLQQ